MNGEKPQSRFNTRTLSRLAEKTGAMVVTFSEPNMPGPFNGFSTIGYWDGDCFRNAHTGQPFADFPVEVSALDETWVIPIKLEKPGKPDDR